MKITFLGAGSTIFAKNVLGDCILTEELGSFEIALFDIDLNRLEESRLMLENINHNYKGKAKIIAYKDRKEALKDAKFVVNAVQVGGYKPSTVIDFEVPKKYGLRQTIADTLGIGGIFRALRTFPVLEGFAEDIHAVAPNALLLNYSNPMAMLTGYMLKRLKLNAVGLCHSVQGCTNWIFEALGMEEYIDNNIYDIYGINHQSWLLKVTDLQGNDLYPEIKRRSLDPAIQEKYKDKLDQDLVRFDLMHRFGYFVTESSEHSAEYMPYFIKSKYPELIEKYKIPLDEYPRRCEEQIKKWDTMKETVLSKDISHIRSKEYGAQIMKAVLTNSPYRIHGNVLNKNLISNLPYDCCVEVPCLVDSNGISPCKVKDLPEQCAALNRTQINVQNLTISAGSERRKELVYMAAYLDPHTGSELSLDDIKSLCDDLFEAHKELLPEYK